MQTHLALLKLVKQMGLNLDDLFSFVHAREFAYVHTWVLISRSNFFVELMIDARRQNEIVFTRVCDLRLPRRMKGRKGKPLVLFQRADHCRQLILLLSECTRTRRVRVP